MNDVMAMVIPLDEIAHVIQVALTPVFLLSGIASLLNVINARLARVADQADTVRALLRTERGGEARLLHGRYMRLRRRLQALDTARACGALAGAAICVATFALFLGALQSTAVATVLFVTFGASVLFTTATLLGFFAEVLLSSRRGVPPLPGEPAREPE